jgi:hypothetical protein
MRLHQPAVRIGFVWFIRGFIEDVDRSDDNHRNETEPSVKLVSQAGQSG